MTRRLGLDYFLMFAMAMCPALADADIDFVKMIQGTPQLYHALGLEKLSQQEQGELNSFLNRIYQLGLENGRKPRTTEAPSAAPRNSRAVYVSRIEDDKGDILKLENGAVVEIQFGFLGFVGFRKEAVLFKDGISWKVWIQGKRVFRCDVIKEPLVGPSLAVQVSVAEVKGDGKLLVTSDGGIFEVGDLNTLDTTLWLAPFDALVLSDSRLINLGEGGDAVDVKKIR